MTNIDLRTRIKVLSVLSNTSASEIAELLGMKVSNFSSKCKTGKMTFAELKNIAGVTGCKFVVGFKFDDGVIVSGNTSTEMIDNALLLKKCSRLELSRRLSKEETAFNKRIKNGKFTDEELSEIATKLGCSYQNYFELPDGTRI